MDLLDHPLFMDKLPANPEDNPILSSLQHLMYDGTPEEVATGFKEQGNKQMALKTKKGYTEAAKFYTQGLIPECPEGVKVVLLGNRAQAQLELKNWGHAYKDCTEVLEIRPNDMKA